MDPYQTVPDLDPYFQKPFKTFEKMAKQTIFVVIGTLSVKTNFIIFLSLKQNIPM